MNMPQQARSDHTRTKIMETSMVLFAQNGYEPTGIAQICRSCGISKGAFYHHFPSKQALFIELLEQWLSALEKEMNRVAAEAKNVPDALRKMAAGMQQVLQEASGRVSFFLEFWTQARHDNEIWQRTIKPFRQYRKVFESLIKKGIDEGSLQKVDPEIAALTLVSLAVGILLQGAVDGGGEKWNEITADALEFFISAMIRKQI
jgi:AcrR family transcriptional regulator